MHHATPTVEAETPSPAVTISAAEYAALVEDKKILDLFEIPGVLFPAGQPGIRKRGRIMLRSKRSIYEVLAEAEARKSARAS